MRSIPQKGKDKKSFFLEARMPFFAVNSGKLSQLSESSQEAEKLAQIKNLLNQKELSVDEKAFLRKEQDNSQLSGVEQEKIQNILQEDNEIIAKNLSLPAGYLDKNQERAFASLSVGEAIRITRNPDDLIDLLNHLNWILSYGEAEHKAILLGNIVPECTKNFLKKNKDSFEDEDTLRTWAELAENAGVHNTEKIVQEIARERGDLNLTITVVQETNVPLILTEKYASEIRNLQKQGISDDIIKSLKLTLNAESEDEKQKNMRNLQSALEAEFAKLNNQSAEKVREELERLFGDPETESGLVFGIIDLVYGNSGLAADVKTNFKKQSRALYAQLEIIERSEGSIEKAFLEIKKRNWGKPQEMANVEKIFSYVGDFKSKIAYVRERYDEAKKGLAKIYNDIKKVDGMTYGHEQQFFVADLPDANFLKRQDVHDFFSSFNISPENQATIVDALRTGEIYFSPALLPETAELADEFGLEDAETAKIIKTEPDIDEGLFLGRKQKFLAKIFDGEEELEAVQKEGLYKDFFSKSDENKLDQSLQDILQQGSELMSLAFQAAKAPKDKEKVAKDLQITIDEHITETEETRDGLQKRMTILSSALANQNDLTDQERKNMRQEIATIKEMLIKLPVDTDIAQLNAAKNTGLSIVNDGDPLQLRDTQGFIDWFKEKIGVSKTANSRLNKANVALGGAGTAEEAKKALQIGTGVNAITAELADIKADLKPKEAQLDQKTEKFLELKNLLIKLRNRKHVSKEELLSFENPDGSAVFNIIADNDWKHEHLRGQITRKGNGYVIYLKESEIVGGALGHEIAHAVDFFANERGNQKLLEAIKDFPEFTNWQKRFEAWKEQENDDRNKQGLKTTDARFEREIFAHLLARDFEGEIGNIALEIEKRLKEAGINPESFLPDEDDLKSGLLEKFFQGDMRSEAASGTAGGENLDPKRIKKMQAMFDLQEKLIRNKLADIKKGDLSGKNEFILGAEDIIADCRSYFNNASTEAELEGVINKMKELNGKSSEVLAINTEQSDVDQGYFQGLWSSTTFLSIRDLKRFWETYVEYTDRRYTTNSKRRTGNAGCAMFKGINDNLSAEFGLLSQSAEKEEVSKYGEPLENMDSWQVYERIAENGSNRDVLKACVRDLAKKGMIDWRSQIIKDAFMRCGAPVRFYPGDDLDLQTLKQKYRKACGAFWDNDEFRSLDRDNNSSYDSKKDGYKNEANLTNDLRSALAKMLLEKRELKDKARVDPMRYEQFIDYSIPMGKMLAEDVIYYIIMGVKEGILTPERAVKLDNAYLNDLPMINYFTSYNPTMAEYYKWGTMFETENGKMPVTFRSWLNTNFLTSARVLERTVKSSSQAKWDHDYAPMISSIGDSTSAKTITASDHGTPKFVPTFYPNTINGMLMHMTDVANNSSELSKEDLMAWLSRQTGYIATTDAVLYGKICKNDRFHRMSQSDINKASRMPGYNGDTGKKALTTGEISERLRIILTNIDPEFFGILFSVRDEHAPDTQEKFEQLKSILSGRLSYAVDPSRAEPQKLEEIFEILEPLTLAILKKNSNTLNKTLEGARQIFKADHTTEIATISWNPEEAS